MAVFQPEDLILGCFLSLKPIEVLGVEETEVSQSEGRGIREALETLHTVTAPCHPKRLGDVTADVRMLTRKTRQCRNKV